VISAIFIIIGVSLNFLENNIKKFFLIMLIIGAIISGISYAIRLRLIRKQVFFFSLKDNIKKACKYYKIIL